MIRLSNLLNEDDQAAEQAHKLGLQSAGWGYWKDKSGQTVARTLNGQLVKLTHDPVQLPGGASVDVNTPHPHDDPSNPDNVKQAYADFEQEKHKSAQAGTDPSTMSDDEFGKYGDYVGAKAAARQSDPWDEDNIGGTIAALNKRTDFSDVPEDQFNQMAQFVPPNMLSGPARAAFEKRLKDRNSPFSRLKKKFGFGQR